jgi:hypothetical protein
VGGVHEPQHQRPDPGHHEVFPDTEPEPTARRSPWPWIIGGIVVVLLFLLFFGHHLGLPSPISIEKLHGGGH